MEDVKATVVKHIGEEFDMRNMASFRCELSKYHGEEMLFTGRIKRKSVKKINLENPGVKGRTLLLGDLYMDGKWVHNHIWISEENINFNENVSWHDLKVGSYIKFTGTIYLYIKDLYKRKMSHNDYNYGIGNIVIIDVNRKVDYTGWEKKIS